MTEPEHAPVVQAPVVHAPVVDAPVVQAPVVRVAVMLEPRPDDLAEWLADAAAFEAAGAEALWVGTPDGDADPLVLSAALAVVTSRALLLMSLPASANPVRALVTLGRLSRGRLRLVATDDGPAAPDAEVARAGRFGLVRLGPHEAVELADPDDPSEPRRWLTVPGPEHRAAWQATIVDAVGRGYSRLLVPANPRLLDILRNPDEPDDRRDLLLAQG